MSSIGMGNSSFRDQATILTILSGIGEARAESPPTRSTSGRMLRKFFVFDRLGIYVTIRSHLDTRRTDRVFKAVGDRTRRRMLDLLAERPRTTGELSAAFPRLSRFAVMKHLGVLKAAGLLIVSRDGRKRWNALNPVPLRDVLRRWLGRHEQLWADALLDIRDAAEAAPRPVKREGDAS
jgi:DNA-binding transcriptional ArsR family regulator